MIRLSGYLAEEKDRIARDYLEPDSRDLAGLKPEHMGVTDDAMTAMIERYCREAGVRNLKKQLEKLYRKGALTLVRKGKGADPHPI